MLNELRQVCFKRYARLKAKPGLMRIPLNGIRLLRNLNKAARPKTIPGYGRYRKFLEGKRGIEIGGPSPAFTRHDLIPVYDVAGSLDGCNLCSDTVWTGKIQEGAGKFLYERTRPQGHQYMLDAVDMHGIESEKYDFLIASHCLEHVANPLKAIREWLRVLVPGGVLVIILPHKDRTFDHRRPVTSLEHLVDDFAKNVGEDDLTHLSEILELHDLRKDPPAGDAESFRERSLKNRENRCLHHHVFDTKLVVDMLDYLKLQLLDVQAVLPCHICALVQKPPATVETNNGYFLSPASPFLLGSPFPTDVGRTKSTASGRG